MNYPIVAVKWADAHASPESYASPDEMNHHPMMLITYGMLVKDDEMGVSLVLEESAVDGEDEWRGHVFIPRPLIQDMWVLAPTPHVKSRDRRGLFISIDAALNCQSCHEGGSDSQ